jgi:hypothetical protein
MVIMIGVIVVLAVINLVALNIIVTLFEYGKDI